MIEKNKNFTVGKWIDFKFKMENCVINHELITLALQAFFKQVLTHLSDDQELMVMFKVQIVNGPFRNISNLQKTTKLEMSDLLNIFLEYWSMRSAEYKAYPIAYIIFTYYIFNKNQSNGTTVSKTLSNNSANKNKSNKLANTLNDTINFGGLSLPATMDITKWGVCDFARDFSSAIVSKKASSVVYHVKLLSNCLVAELKINNKTVLIFTDYLNNGANLNTFTRVLGNNTYIFEDSVLKLKSRTYKNKFISTKNVEHYFKTKFLTMDLETRTIQGVMEVYHITLFDGKVFYNFYLADYRNSDEMLDACIKSLLLRKYRGYVIYLHNFAGFDGIFLLKRIAVLSPNADIIMKDNKIISLKVKYFNSQYTITFRDSFLILPSSLQKLAISFDVPMKIHFPILLPNEVDLKYSGAFPDFKYFKKIKLLEYLELKSNFEKEGAPWVLRTEVKKYCERDVETLYQVIMKFSESVFSMFRVNVLNYPTISSLSFAIFRTIYLKDSKLPILTGELYNFIRKAYTGGAVDVFKPYARHVYRYDVNSLYPFIMKGFEMPVGNATYIEGDFSILDKNKVYFVEAEVKTPKNLNNPLLQTRIKNKLGEQFTASPLGSWTGVHTSAEIKAAKALGYKFKFLRAVSFDKAKVFSEFVDFFFNLKQNSERGSSNYVIAKFFLNSLSGRFALDPNLDKHLFANTYEVAELLKSKNIKSLIPLTDDINLLSYSESEIESVLKSPNVSIAISALITSMARVWMYQFKDKNTIYTDTDSIDTTVLLNPKWIGYGLGQFKLENVFEEAVYLAPKVHGGINKNHEVVRVKGLKNPISYKELKSLLVKDSKLEISQDKWLKDYAEGRITIRNEIYSLMVTGNKRELLYGDNNILTDTKPLFIKET